MKVKDITKKLKKNGGTLVRQRGSHQRWKIQKNGETAYTTVSVHSGDVPIGTVKAIEKDLQPLLGERWLL